MRRVLARPGTPVIRPWPPVNNAMIATNHQKGRVAVPLLLWVAGVPFTLVFLLWLFFFRGH